MYKRIFLNSLLQSVLICALALSGAAQSPDERDSIFSHEEIGQASWYGPEHHGKKTATGDTFDQHAMTAAHPSLPLGTQAEVTNLENNKKVIVTINDRGPHGGKRAIDISRAAAIKLDMTTQGTARVRIQQAGWVKPANSAKSINTLIAGGLDFPEMAGAKKTPCWSCLLLGTITPGDGIYENNKIGGVLLAAPANPPWRMK